MSRLQWCDNKKHVIVHGTRCQKCAKMEKSMRDEMDRIRSAHAKRTAANRRRVQLTPDAWDLLNEVCKGDRALIADLVNTILSSRLAVTQFAKARGITR